ncbi:hypothetical protein DNTS_027835 [Danionella cerebrum]|uniref:Uncharacterized protein n=1 Tax=Danionella cerebrum TaxID=2873325 RepID=A0A553N1X7_9TELE|nr:hypothetical protein DNTS_027835 [Danionella translucida]
MDSLVLDSSFGEKLSSLAKGLHHRPSQWSTCLTPSVSAIAARWVVARTVGVTVNETSLSITHDQDVEAFQTPKDPSEVRCRSTNKTTNPIKPIRGIDSSTQTNITLQYLNHIESLAQLPLPPESLCKAVLGSIQPPIKHQAAKCDLHCLSDFDECVWQEHEHKRLETEEADVQRKTSPNKLGEIRYNSPAENIGKSPRSEEGGTADTQNHKKESGAWIDENSQIPDILVDDVNSCGDTLPENKIIDTRGTFESEQRSKDSFLIYSEDGGNFLGIPGTSCEHFRNLLKLKYLMKGNKIQGFREHDVTVQSKSNSVDCYDQEVQMLNEELLRIELECLSIIQAHRAQAENNDLQPKIPSTKHFTDQTHQDPMNNKVDYEGSTSAYNTGESCWSLPPALESDPPEGQRIPMGDRTKGSPMHRRNSTTTCTKHNLCPIQEISPTKALPGNPEIANQWKKHQRKKRKSKSILTTAYKNVYIPAHAQHYQSYMQLIQQKSAVEYAQSHVNLGPLCKKAESTPADSKPKRGRKVKVRSEEPKYITKRPVRNQLLKERALRIREERCSATTDDDAASELKLGRYWNKKERKEHAAQAQQLRHQRELKKQSWTEINGKKDSLDDKEPDIIQLSRKRMMKRRNKKIFDNWMTIQELLTHGSKTTVRYNA